LADEARQAIDELRPEPTADLAALRALSPLRRRYALLAIVPGGVSLRRPHLEDLDALVLRGQGEVLLGGGLGAVVEDGTLTFVSGRRGRSD
ncbi:MAG: hypothetical protein AAF645_10245, partial [Myxococcota bacterium]